VRKKLSVLTFDIGVLDLRKLVLKGIQGQETVHDGLIVTLESKGRRCNYAQQGAEGLAPKAKA
jgi:hypothetical protein